MSATTHNQAMIDHLMTATHSRRSLLAKAGLFGLGSAAFTLGVPAFASAQATPMADAAMDAMFANPVDVLNYALTLEHLEAAFYRDGLAMVGEAGFSALGFQSSVYQYLMEISAHEAEHVTTLTDVITKLGGEPVAEAKYDFGVTDAASFLKTSQALEDTGVSAYQGAAQYLIDEDDLLTAALTIHGVEARHAAYVAVLNGVSPFPGDVNPTLTPEEVLKIATPLIVP